VKQTIATVCALLMLTGSAAAADKPDFSGDWTMNVAKSNFGILPPPISIKRKITHAEPAMTIVEDQDGGAGVVTTTRVYTTDGKETTFTSQGAEVKTAAKWDGDTLVVDSKVDVAGLLFNDKMTLSADGKALTSTIVITSPQGAVDLVVVFER
jgi:hypothetical protein